MSKYKRVWGMLGVLGILATLIALTSVSPASASVPTNRIDLFKVVSGVPTQAGNFNLRTVCADPDGAGPLVEITYDNSFGDTGGNAFINVPGEYTSCVVSETLSRGATVTAYATTTTAALGTNLILAGAPAASATVQFPRQPDLPAGQSQQASVLIVNSYRPTDPNFVDVTKVTTGIVPPGAIVEIRASCTTPSGAYSYGAVWLESGGQMLSAAGQATQAIPVPNDCANPVTITEPITQPAPLTTTIDDDTIVFDALPLGGQRRNAVVRNNYAGPANRITITKNVVGPVPAGTTFGGTVTCGGVVRNWAFGSNGGTTEVSIPAGAATQVCTVLETAAGLASSTSVQTTIQNGAIFTSNGIASVFGFANANGGHTAQVTYTNRYFDGPRRTITVNKAVTGTMPAGNTALVQVNCNYDMDPITPGSQQSYTMAFNANTPATQSVQTPAVSAADSCTVIEPNSAGASSRTFAGGPTTGATLTVTQDVTGTPGSVFIDWTTQAIAADAQVNINNRYTAKQHPDNILRIKKQLRGRIPAGASFVIRVSCSGGGITDVRNLTFTTNSFLEISVPSARSNCVVKETANGGAQSVSYFASSATADATDGPNSGRVDFGTTVGAQRGKVIVRNQFPGTCPRPGPKFC